MKIIKFLFIFLLGIISFNGYSQSITSLELGTTSLTGNTTGSATFTSKDPNISSLPQLTLTSGQQGQASGTGYVSSKAWNTTTQNTSNYWTFTITASSGYYLSVSSITIKGQRSGTGPTNVALRSSIDGYASNIGSQSGLQNNSTTISFSSLSISNQTSITFRVYGWEASNSNAAGTWRIGDGSSASLDIDVQGSVTTISCPSITTQPSNSSIVWGNGTTLSISAINTTGYQWEINTGSGWSSIIDNSTYSGSTTPTLSITNATVSMNGYKYRCILSASSCSNITSDSSILTVNNRTNQTSGIIINEISQGESVGLGTKEYVEMLVIGTPCSNIDIRGWIIDDNNGIFSGGPGSSVGIATGYFKFSNNSLWSSIPVGTIILIYNNSDTSSLITTYFDNDPTDYKLIFAMSNSTYFTGYGISPSISDSSYSS